VVVFVSIAYRWVMVIFLVHLFLWILIEERVCDGEVRR
jgi:hypothetical protein